MVDFQQKGNDLIKIKSGRIRGVTRASAIGDVVVYEQVFSSTGFVPYSGASADVDLGAFSIKAQGLINNFGTASVTNQRELRAGLVAGFVDIGSFAGVPTYAAMYMNQGTPGATNYALASDGTTNLFINAPTNTSTLTITKANGSYWALLTGDTTSGAVATWDFRTSNKTAITAGQPAADYIFNFAGTHQWSTGAIPISYGIYVYNQTLTAVGASVIATAYGTYLNEPAASTNIIINNNYALGLGGSLSLATMGKFIAIKEGVGGRMGQATLVAGTLAITITGVTTSSRAFVTLVTANTTTLTTTYQAVCTANTLTIRANVAAGTINIADISTLNYIVYEPAA